MKTIITNATIVAHDKIIESEISIDHGLITEIGEALNKENAMIIDAKDCFVLPGAVDIHTRLAYDAKQKVSQQAFEENSLAALYGGTTTVIEEIDSEYSPENSLEAYKELLSGHSYIDYSFHQCVKNTDQENITKALQNLHDGFPSLCTSMAKIKGTIKQNDDEILTVVREFSRYGATAFIHCESQTLIKLLEELHTIKNRLAPYALASTRPNWTESEAFIRMCNLSRAGNVSFCADTISTKDVVSILYKQSYEGLPVSVSVCPLHLLFTDDVYKSFDEVNESAYKYMTYPPLRKKEDVNALWQALRDGVIHFVTSKHDGTHLKFKREQAKNNALQCPIGVPSVELRLSLLYTFGVLTNKIDMKKLVEITASHVTRIAGLRGKGRIEAGTDADIVIFDPQHKKQISLDTLHEACDYSPYEGMELQGFAKHVFLRGKHIINNFTLKDTKRNGVLAKRKAIAMPSS